MALPSWLTRPSPLAWRIYVIGLVQFALVAALMEVNRRTGQRPEPWERDTRFVAGGLARTWDDRDELRKDVQRAAENFTWKVDVRDPDGVVVAHGEPDAAHARFDARSPHGSVPITLRDGRIAHLDYVIAPRHHGPVPGLPFGLGFPSILVLVVVGLTSVIASRSLATPLANLADVARRFGSGKLDARARMQRNDEIGDVAKAFDEMADRIASLLLAERELLANVSHELRTPLARIRVALDLAHEAEPKVAVESLGEIAQDLAELERIVDDVLASARLALESNDAMADSSLPIRSEDVDVRELLERSIAKLASQHPGRPVKTKIAHDLPTVSGDPVLLRRVVDNLLDNAHKYSEDASAPIDLDARADGDGIVIEVRDRGIGIAKDDLQRLFEPFFRADRSRTRATGGLGLGLALSRRVVVAHRGSIAFESELGKGTVARVRLPVRRD